MWRWIKTLGEQQKSNFIKVILRLPWDAHKRRGSQSSMEDGAGRPPLLSGSDGDRVCTLPQSVKISSQWYILHSFCTVYQGGYPQEQCCIGSRYTSITFRIRVQKKIRCLLFRELETLPPSMYMLRMALLIHVIIQVLNRGDLRLFKSVNKAKN